MDVFETVGSAADGVCWLLLKQHHCSAKMRMQMIPRVSIKLLHKRIDDCETEAMMKQGFIFSSPQGPDTPEVIVSSLSCLLGH